MKTLKELRSDSFYETMSRYSFIIGAICIVPVTLAVLSLPGSYYEKSLRFITPFAVVAMAPFSAYVFTKLRLKSGASWVLGWEWMEIGKKYEVLGQYWIRGENGKVVFTNLVLCSQGQNGATTFQFVGVLSDLIQVGKFVVVLKDVRDLKVVDKEAGVLVLLLSDLLEGRGHAMPTEVGPSQSDSAPAPA